MRRCSPYVQLFLLVLMLLLLLLASGLVQAENHCRPSGNAILNGTDIQSTVLKMTETYPGILIAMGPTGLCFVPRATHKQQALHSTHPTPCAAPKPLIPSNNISDMNPLLSNELCLAFLHCSPLAVSIRISTFNRLACCY